MIKNKLNVLFIASITATFSLISCGGGSEETETTVSEEPVVVEDEVVPTENVSDFSAGEAIYNGKGLCHTCHQMNGEGIPSAFPPLAGADYLLADINRAIVQTIYGSKDPIVVNGIEYPGGVMSATVKDIGLTDQEVADVVNYVLNSWGNDGGTVSIADVEAARSSYVE
ncbi:MAG: cytochrome c [Bacteroidetes bacterium]|nr:cytochrome c [Bacteroidota bacterium]